MGYWKVKEEALGRTVYRTGFGRGCGSVGKTGYAMTERTCTRFTSQGQIIHKNYLLLSCMLRQIIYCLKLVI